MATVSDTWTNSSVKSLAGDRDPVEVITNIAQQTVLEAMEKGWSGPPFDPFQLARLLNIPVAPRQELRDARTVPVGHRGVRIEYNPTRPTTRLRFSIAHEIAHSLFPDVAEAVRNRGHFGSDAKDSWQLELLCNIAAGEMLMPTQTLGDFDSEGLALYKLLGMRADFGVSTEAMLRRAAKLTRRPAAMFAASRVDDSRPNSPFRLDYLVKSRTWDLDIPYGFRIKSGSVLGECTAIDFTARRQERWNSEDLFVEAVGVHPYPGQRHPRVLGILQVRDGLERPDHRIQYVFGDATLPRGEGTRLIAHVVNDKTSNWGGKFARALRSRYPGAQEDFQDRTAAGEGLRLGRIFLTRVTEDLGVVTMVAQHGYGPSKQPRIRYLALHRCLQELSEIAVRENASVHMPRIGAGMGGGEWAVIRELVDDSLCRAGVDVLVYTLPSDRYDDEAVPTQGMLRFDAGFS